MDILLLIIYAMFGVGIGFWAKSWGRNFWGWTIFGFLIPIIAAVALVIAGKSLARKAQDQAEIDRLKAEAQSAPADTPGSDDRAGRVVR